MSWNSLHCHEHVFSLSFAHGSSMSHRCCAGAVEHHRPVGSRDRGRIGPGSTRIYLRWNMKKTSKQCLLNRLKVLQGLHPYISLVQRCPHGAKCVWKLTILTILRLVCVQIMALGHVQNGFSASVKIRTVASSFFPAVIGLLVVYVRFCVFELMACLKCLSQNLAAFCQIDVMLIVGKLLRDMQENTHWECYPPVKKKHCYWTSPCSKECHSSKLTCCSYSISISRKQLPYVYPICIYIYIYIP